MRFRDFKLKISTLAIFNLNDIRKIDPSFHRQQLTDWQQRGFIQPVANGYYLIADREVNEGFLFMAANRIYSPSYVSLESALAYHQFIPESVLGVTSISSRKTRRFETPWGQFVFRSVKPELMFGYQVIVTDPNQKYLIAAPEKTVLDYLYLNTHIRSIDDFDGLRWNKAQLMELLDFALLNRFLSIFCNKALVNRVNILKRYLDA